MLFDAAVDAAILLVTVPTLVMNWRTQRAAAAIVSSAAQSGPPTERWTTAVTMLARRNADGPTNVETRLGAIYSIEQIARDFPGYRGPAMDLLAAYVREYAQSGQIALEPSTEMQSVLTVLGRNDLTGLDLRRTVLWGADLEGAGLVEANLYEARLRGARLSGARLVRARLRSADLTDADLSGADLSNAILKGARLRGANLTGAILRGADLHESDLTGAGLGGANLRDASLVGALLDEAILDGADLTGTTLGGVDLSGASLGPAVASRDHIWLPMVSRPASMTPATR
ncbi:MAG: pentapeptide repeat-containing protein [Chloroflexota bacterium]